MKPFPILLALFAVGSGGLQAGANPRGLGPSAIEAARLKYYPPGGYLSHYLPDDRYKIAGNVWKYVSTDLDTYYHVPSSPNMMRQPADRVIGFASAADAEEAGYTADPSDGTPQGAVSKGSFTGRGRSTAADLRYLNTLAPLFGGVRNLATNLQTQLNGAVAKGAQGGTNVNDSLAAIRVSTAQDLQGSRNLLSRFNALRPPPRFRRLHSASRTYLTDFYNLVYLSNRTAISGDLRNVGAIQMQQQKMIADKGMVEREMATLRQQK